MFKAAQVTNWIQAQHANANQADAAALFLSLSITGVAPLKSAGPNDLAFFFSKSYVQDLMQTRAGLIITGNAFVSEIEKSGLPQWKKTIFLSCADPYGAMAIVSKHFSREISSHDHQSYPEESQIHPSAVIAKDAKIGKLVRIGAHSVIEAGCVIHDGVTIYPQCYVGHHSEIGEGSVLFPRVTLYEKTKIGKKCRIHSGVVIGGDGFGYAPLLDAATKLPFDQQKIYHLGRVTIGDDVEIGSNSTIDRGTLGDTIIHSKVKIDNLVQVGHNCEIGEGSVLCGMSGMAGSSSLGKYTILGAQAGTSNQVHVGDYAKIGGYTGLAKDVEPHAEMSGIPGRPLSDHYRILAIQNKLLREQKQRKK